MKILLTHGNGMMINYNFFTEIFQTGQRNLFPRKRFPSLHFFFKKWHGDDHYLRNTQYNTLNEKREQTKLWSQTISTKHFTLSFFQE